MTLTLNDGADVLREAPSSNVGPCRHAQRITLLLVIV